MPDPIPQPNPVPIVPPQHSWFVRHLLAEVLAVVAVAAALGLIYYFQVGRMPAVVQPPAHVAKVDVTKDWKTYTNGQYGFLLKYPSEWSVTSDHDSNGYYEVQWNGPDNSYLNIHIDDNPQNLSIPDYYKNKDASKIFTLNVINNQRFYAVSTSAEEFYVANNSNIYVIDLNTESNITKPILSTFKFTPITFTITDSQKAGWKTYTNKVFNFQFQYPSDLGLPEETKINDTSFPSITSAIQLGSVNFMIADNPAKKSEMADAFKLSIDEANNPPGEARKREGPYVICTKQTISNPSTTVSAVACSAEGSGYAGYIKGVNYDILMTGDVGIVEKEKLKPLFLTFKER